jgi:hypothetical protein
MRALLSGGCAGFACAPELGRGPELGRALAACRLRPLGENCAAAGGGGITTGMASPSHNTSHAPRDQARAPNGPASHRLRRAWRPTSDGVTVLRRITRITARASPATQSGTLCGPRCFLLAGEAGPPPPHRPRHAACSSSPPDGRRAPSAPARSPNSSPSAEMLDTSSTNLRRASPPCQSDGVNWQEPSATDRQLHSR